MSKWITYTKERFPLLQYIPMMLTFSFCAVSYSMHLSNSDAKISDINIIQYITAFLSTIFFFMLIRIADEHKDFEEDTTYRPYRPVQRGLVTLRELRWIGVFLLLGQIAMAIFIEPWLLLVLLIVYAWLTLMTVEFFLAKWLKKKHTLYLLSHMVILPLIDMYATSLEWLPRGGGMSLGIVVFMISSFCDGTVVEVGRKLRAKENEEYGVDTYTQIWGAKKAMFVWMICMSISFVSTVLAGFQVKAGIEILLVLFVLYCYAGYIAWRFAKDPTSKNAKIFEIFPGFWMISMYLLLGIIPFLK
jgi:4-hydroxybenzoate polyprenyltransferase